VSSFNASARLAVVRCRRCIRSCPSFSDHLLVERFKSSSLYQCPPRLLILRARPCLQSPSCHSSTHTIHSFSMARRKNKIVIPNARTTTALKSLDERPSQAGILEKRRKYSHSPTSVGSGSSIERLRFRKRLDNDERSSVSAPSSDSEDREIYSEYRPTPETECSSDEYNSKQNFINCK